MAIRWTKTSRKKLHGVRHAHRSDPSLIQTAGAAWAWLRARRQHCATFTTLKAEPPFQAVLDAVLASMEGDLPGALDVQAELARAGIVLTESRYGENMLTLAEEAVHALVVLWMEAGGLDFVLEMYQATAPFHVDSWSSSEGTSGVTLVSAGSGNHAAFCLHSVAFLRPFWWAMRRHLMSLPGADFQAARDRIEVMYDDLMGFAGAVRLDARLRDYREMAPGPERDAAWKLVYPDLQSAQEKEKRAVLLAFAFARDPAWAHDHARRMAASTERTGLKEIPWILASITDAELGRALAKARPETGANLVVPYRYDLVEGMGEGAAGVIEEILDRWGPNHADAKKLRSVQALALSGG